MVTAARPLSARSAASGLQPSGSAVCQRPPGTSTTTAAGASTGRSTDTPTPGRYSPGPRVVGTSAAPSSPAQPMRKLPPTRLSAPSRPVPTVHRRRDPAMPSSMAPDTGAAGAVQVTVGSSQPRTRPRREPSPLGPCRWSAPEARLHRLAVRGQVLVPGERHDPVPDLGERVGVVLDDLD